MKKKLSVVLSLVLMLQAVLLGGLISSSASYSQSLSSPTDLRAIEITTNSVRLRWSNSETASVSGYEIYIDNSKAGTVNGTGANISNLSKETIYKFKVRAINSDGDKSLFSNEISIKTSVNNQIILPPINLEKTEVSHDYVRLNWESPGENVNIAKYEIYHDGIFLGSINSTQARISNLVENTLYIFEIASVNSNGQKSNSKALIPIKTLSQDASYDIEAPSNLELVEVTNSMVRLKWQSVENASGYYIYLDDTRLGSVKSNSARLTNLSPDTKYKITVIAFKTDIDKSKPSSILPVTTLSTNENIVLPPKNLRAIEIQNNMVRLRWDAPNNQDVVKYRVYSNNQPLGTVKGNGALIQSLSPDSSYQYQVLAIDSVGNESVKSNMLNITTVSD